LGISPVALDGVVEQVRTALTVLVAEIHAHVPEGTETPSADVASNALAVAVSGKRNTVTVTSPQGGSTVATAPASDSPEHLAPAPHRRGGHPGLVGIAAVVFGLMQVQDWSF
jgi:hypothetical protein